MCDVIMCVVRRDFGKKKAPQSAGAISRGRLIEQLVMGLLRGAQRLRNTALSVRDPKAVRALSTADVGWQVVVVHVWVAVVCRRRFRPQ